MRVCNNAFLITISRSVHKHRTATLVIHYLDRPFFPTSCSLLSLSSLSFSQSLSLLEAFRGRRSKGQKTTLRGGGSRWLSISKDLTLMFMLIMVKKRLVGKVKGGLWALVKQIDNNKERLNWQKVFQSSTVYRNNVELFCVKFYKYECGKNCIYLTYTSGPKKQ